MPRTHTEEQRSDATKLRAFFERATLIRQHALYNHSDASIITPNMPAGSTIQDAVAQPDVDHNMEGIDWKLFPVEQWIDLACLVRPLVFTDTDKIRWSLIMQIISRADPALKALADAVNNTYKTWVKTKHFAMEELGEATEQDENTILVAADLDIDLSDVAGDYTMATKMLNGQIFHVNLDYWTWLKQYPDGVVLKAHMKAAQYRVVSSCIHIENVRNLIMMGWASKVLPVLT